MYRDQLIVFLLVLTRVGGLVMVAPILGSRSVPIRVRAALACCLALPIAVLNWDVQPYLPGGRLEFSLQLAREAIVGLSMGLALVMVVGGLQLAGSVIGQISGLQIAEAADPSTGAADGPLGQLLILVALAVFVSVDGHRQVLDALLETYRWMPLGRGNVSPGFIETVTETMTLSFRLAVRATAPVMISLAISSLVLGLIGRAVPQLNVLSIGFNLQAVVLLATLLLSLGTIAWLFDEYVAEAVRLIQDSLHG